MAEIPSFRRRARRWADRLFERLGSSQVLEEVCAEVGLPPPDDVHALAASIRALARGAIHFEVRDEEGGARSVTVWDRQGRVLYRESFWPGAR